MSTPRTAWGHVLGAARDIVDSYDTLVTLRQLFYRLVASLVIPNTEYHYKRLSAKTAEARRAGDFPDLIDEGREILGTGGDKSPAQAPAELAEYYRRDHTEGQPVSLYLAAEKRGMVAQLSRWFGGRASILGLGGYASQSYVDDVRRHVARQGRPAILLYAGDHDPTGWDIDRDFIDRTGGCFDTVTRLALHPEQVIEHRLPPLPGKATDSRAGGFVARFGELVQVELDALPPDVLRGLFQAEIDRFWDVSLYEAVLAREAAERAELAELARRW